MLQDEFTGEVRVCLPNGSYKWCDSLSEAELEEESYWESYWEAMREDEYHSERG